jgi:hypothetical protein
MLNTAGKTVREVEPECDSDVKIAPQVTPNTLN